MLNILPNNKYSQKPPNMGQLIFALHSAGKVLSKPMTQRPWRLLIRGCNEIIISLRGNFYKSLRFTLNVIFT